MIHLIGTNKSKLSFHLLNTQILYSSINMLAIDLKKIQIDLQTKSKLLNIKLTNINDSMNTKHIAMHMLEKSDSMDYSVYNCNEYQLLRSPECIKFGERQSVKRLIYGKRI